MWKNALWEIGSLSEGVDASNRVWKLLQKQGMWVDCVRDIDGGNEKGWNFGWMIIVKNIHVLKT